MRRTVLNLTPLLDLLLIIIFASQINTWVQADEERKDAQKEITRLTTAQRELNMYTTRVESEKAMLEAALAKAKASEAMERTAREKLAAELIEAVRKLAAATAVAAEMLRSNPGALSSDQRNLLKELVESGGKEAKTLRTMMQRYAKVAEVVSIWEAYLPSDYRLVIRRQGSEPMEILLEDSLDGIEDSLVDAMRRLPEPSRVALLFFSYGELKVQRKDRVTQALSAAFRDRLAVTYPESKFYFVEEGYDIRRAE
jgi:hypothetical protein